jgi:hypothetical protein
VTLLVTLKVGFADPAFEEGFAVFLKVGLEETFVVDFVVEDMF